MFDQGYPGIVRLAKLFRGSFNVGGEMLNLSLPMWSAGYGSV